MTTLKTIGRYEIIEQIGQGGMAAVYLARDPNMKRQVAVKLLPPELHHDPQFHARFQNEAEVIAALEHPFIVPIYDFDSDELQSFIVMRYLPNGTLGDYMKEKGPLDLATTNTIISRLCLALADAHERSIVHRDLKPSNVMFDHRNEAFLTDFGIAKFSGGSMQMTTGIIGTPEYMSPEQAIGKANIDGRSDIYTLGILIFEMLTGQQPYEADTPMGVALKHITEPPPNIRDANPDLPSPLVDFIKRMMAKDPDDRFQTTLELSEAFNELVFSVTKDSGDATRRHQDRSPDSTIVRNTGTDDAHPAPPIKSPHQLRVLAGHDAPVLAVAVNARRDVWASSDSAGHIVLWNALTGHIIQQLDRHEGSIHTLAFSPDGQLLASGGDDRTIRLWAAPTGQPLRTIATDSSLSALAFSPDSHTLASAGDDTNVYLWDVGGGQQQLVLTGHRDWVRDLAFSSDGRLLASASGDQTVRIWSMPAGQLVRALSGRGGTMWTVAFVDDRLLSGSHSGLMQLWDLASGRCLKAINGPASGVWSLAMLPGQQQFITAGFDSIIRQWQLNTGRLMQVYSGHERWVRSLALSREGETFVSVGDDQTLRVWSLAG